MKKTPLFIIIFILLTEVVHAQTVYTVNNGSWNVPATWNTNVVPVASSNIEIRNTVNIASAAVGASLTVISGATLQLDNGGTIGITGQITFAGGSVYRHNQNGGIVPTAAWQPESTCRIIGVVGTVPSGLTQNFHHFAWNCVTQQNIPPVYLQGNPSVINGDLLIENTGTSGRVFLGYNVPNSGSVTIGRDLKVSGGRLALTGSGTMTVNVQGDVSITSTFTPATTSAFLFSSSLMATLNVNGNFFKSGSNPVDFGSSITVQNTTLNVKGHVTFTAGSIIRSVASNSNYTSVIRFNGTVQQNFIRTGGTFSSTNSLDFIVNAGSILNLGSNTINQATGNFISDGTVRFGSGDASDAIRGNIPSLGLQFNSASTISYNGNVAQFMGSAHPATSGVITRIENTSPGGVTLNAPATMGGDLFLLQNTLFLATHTLTLNANFTPNAHFLSVTPASSIAINGSGVFGTLKLSGNSLNNLTVNRAGGNISLINNLTVDGTLTQNNGDISIGSNVLTINGPFIRSGGSLQGNSSSFIIQGSGSLPVNVDLAGIFQKIELNRGASTFATNSAFEVFNLDLKSGQFANTTSMSISNNGLIQRFDNGSLSQTPSSSGFYNVRYLNISDISAGAELPASIDTDYLRDLQVAGSGSVTLLSDIFINNDLLISSGNLLCQSRIITLRGDLLTNQLGDFTLATIIFDGDNSEIIDPPVLGNIQLNSGKILKLPSTTCSVLGNINFEEGSVVEANSGILKFSGGISQTFSGGGNIFNKLEVDKSSGALVQLTSDVFITNELSIISANTTFDSNNFLTLLSTSDEADGNAWIGSLLNGANVTGEVTVQRFMRPGRIYRYISSPVNNVTVADLMDNFPVTGTFSNPSTTADFPDITGIVSSSPSFYFYNEAISGGLQNGWTNYPSVGLASDNPLISGKGYGAFIRNNIDSGPTTWDVKGEINQGDFDFTITYTNTLDGALVDGWNLVGNPYPSSIYWDDTNWVKTNVSETIAIKDNLNLGSANNPGGFLYWDGQLGGDFDGRIATGQAFWVQALGADPMLQVNEQAKSTTGSFFRTAGMELSYVKIKLTKGTISDAAYVRIREGSKLQRDKFDAVKLDNDLFDLSTLSSENTALAINAIPELSCEQTINLNVKDLTAGSYSFSMELAGLFNDYSWYLKDMFSNTETLINTGEYGFIITDEINSKKSDRFQLYIKRASILRLNLSVVAPELICYTENALITIDHAQVGVTYQLDINGTLTNLTVEGNGQLLPIVVENDLFVNGLNTVKVFASSTCEGQYLTTSTVIKKLEKLNVTIEEASPGLLKSNFTVGNQWYLNNVELTGENNQYIPIDSSGVYKVKVTNEGCSEEASYEYVINEISSNQRISIYPNPVVNTLILELPLDNSGRFFEVLDNIGKVLDNQKSAPNQNEIRLNFSFYSSGSYFVRVTSGTEIRVYQIMKR